MCRPNFNASAFFAFPKLNFFPFTIYKMTPIYLASEFSFKTGRSFNTYRNPDPNANPKKKEWNKY